VAHFSKSKVVATALAALALGGGLSACAKSSSSSAAASTKLSRFTFVVSSSAGGGADTIARQISPFWQSALGTTVTITNEPAGLGTVGGIQTANDSSCQTAIIYDSPAVQVHTLDPKVNFGLQGSTTSKPTVYPIGSIAQDVGVIVVPQNSPYKTLADLINAAKAKPGQLLVPVSSTYGDTYFRLLQLEKALNVKFNLVPYSGGSAAQTALLSGKAAMEYTGIVNQIPLQGKTRVLAVADSTNPQPAVTNNAPTLQSAVTAAYKVTLPSNGVWLKTYGVYISSACKSAHPATFTKLVSSLKSAFDDSAYQAALKKTNTFSRHAYVAPSPYFTQMSSQFATVKELGLHE
jgi:tripartite-type tricarboxylate transporter receptor subunit TctC